MSQTDGGAGRDRFETLAVHAGADPDPASGAVVPPIQLSTTFKQDGVGGTRDGYEYARTGNPTRRTLEAAIAALEGGTHGLAYASGMAAAQNVLYLVEPGERIVMSDDVYGGTWRLADRVWRRYGVEPVPVDLRDLDALAAVLAPGDDRRPVRMVWVETPTNPLLKIVDISAVVRLAAAAGAMTVVDNTFATPFLQRPLELGADLVLHSATKYLGGHSDVVGGLLATRRADLAERSPSTRTPPVRCLRHSTAGSSSAACAPWRCAWSGHQPTRRSSPTGSRAGRRLRGSTIRAFRTIRSVSCWSARCGSPVPWSASRWPMTPAASAVPVPWPGRLASSPSRSRWARWSR